MLVLFNMLHKKVTKVKNIKEDSLDLIPSPSSSVKIQVIVGKFT